MEEGGRLFVSVGVAFYTDTTKGHENLMIYNYTTSTPNTNHFRQYTATSINSHNFWVSRLVELDVN